MSAPERPTTAPATATRNNRLPGWFPRAVVLVLVAVAIYHAVLWAGGQLAGLIGLLFLAWLASIAMEPAVAWMAKRGMRRGLATGITMGGLAIVGSAFLTVFGALLVDQVTGLVVALPDALTSLLTWANETFNLELDVSSLPAAIGLTPEDIQKIVTDMAPGIFGVIASIVGGVFQGVTLLFFAFYMSAQAPQLQRLVSSWFPTNRQHVVSTVWRITVEKTGGYVNSRMILAVLCAAFMAVAMVILGVPYWLPLAIWTGVVAQFIPTVGTYIGIALPALIALTNDPWDAVWVIALGTAYQGLENYLLAPRITAATVSIHPAVAFAAVIAGASLFGAIGALVSVPVAAAVQAVIETYGRRYELAEDLDLADLPGGPGEGGPKGGGEDDTQVIPAAGDTDRPGTVA